MTILFSSSLAVIAVLFLSSCSPSAKSIASRDKVSEIATRKFGGTFEVIPSPDNDFLLCRSEDGKHVPLQSVRFFLFNTKQDSVVYERELENGSVHWLEGSKLEITRIPGNVTGNEKPDSFTEIYDAKTGLLTKK